MKKLLSLVFCGLLLFGCSDKYDDSALRNDLNDLESRNKIRGTLHADEHQYFIVAEDCRRITG